MNAKEKQILKEMIHKLSKLWKLDEVQTIRKIARFINFNEPAVITKLLYSCTKEDK